MPSRPKSLPVTLAIVYVAAVALVFYQGMGLCDGHFLYEMDDAYIHLALADSLAHGHYGINLNEPSSPSSSLLWPILLIPFHGTSLQQYMPLVWGLLAGMASAVMIGMLLERWPPLGGAEGRMPAVQRLLTGLLLVACTNLVGLTALGMEHILQVALAIACGWGIEEALSGRPIPSWCVAAALIAPAVRYEDLSLTLGISLALVGQRRTRTAAGLFGLSVVPLIGFGLFLHSQGLAPLPMSVLAKASVYSGTMTQRISQELTSSMRLAFAEPERIPILVITLIFAGLSIRAKERFQRWALAGTAVVGAMQLLVGRFGWRHRYEVYALAFLLVVLMRVTADQRRFSFGFFALPLAMCALTYVESVSAAPLGMFENYAQQYQAHRFLNDFYQGNFAVTDLGIMSFQRRPRSYVLDLGGLASKEALLHTDRSAESTAWLADIAKRHDAKILITYMDWVAARPASWTALMQVCVAQTSTIGAPEPCLIYFSTDPAYNARLRSELESFAKTIPASMQVQFAKISDGPPEWLPDRHLP